MGLLKAGTLHEAAVVPSVPLLRHAAALGIIPTADLATFEGRLAAARAVVSAFGDRGGFGDALQRLDLALSVRPAL